MRSAPHTGISQQVKIPRFIRSLVSLEKIARKKMTYNQVVVAVGSCQQLPRFQTTFVVRLEGRHNHRTE